MTKIAYIEQKHLRYSLVFPLILSAIILLVYLLPVEKCYGIYPREIKTGWGIITSPFFHADRQHLWSNIGSLYFFVAGLCYYYPKRIISVPIFGILSVNISVWLAAHSGCHIGASGLIYYLAAYLVTKAMFNKHRNLAAYTLIVVFLYGGMVWGIIPMNETISWESHIFGALWGVVAGMYHKTEKAWTDHYCEDSNTDNCNKQAELSDALERRILDNEEYIYYTTHSTIQLFRTSQDIDNWLNYRDINHDTQSSNTHNNKTVNENNK